MKTEKQILEAMQYHKMPDSCSLCDYKDIDNCEEQLLKDTIELISNKNELITNLQAGLKQLAMKMKRPCDTCKHSDEFICRAPDACFDYDGWEWRGLETPATFGKALGSAILNDFMKGVE